MRTDAKRGRTSLSRPLLLVGDASQTRRAPLVGSFEEATAVCLWDSPNSLFRANCLLCS